jgi:hypothetical protein
LFVTVILFFKKVSFKYNLSFQPFCAGDVFALLWKKCSFIHHFYHLA